METLRSCPDCGCPLPNDAPEGMCPECLMKGALESMDDMTQTFNLPSSVERTELPEPGETFGGYRIERELGRGGMGAVYAADELETGRRVALKVLNYKLDSAESRARFFREGRLAASINHPNSVYVYSTGEIEGTPIIVMELIAGRTLRERVNEDGPLPLGAAVDAMMDVISGLQEAEKKGILHRDIKPANCFEDMNGTVKIGDFGLSISSDAREDVDITQEGAFLGTPAFASPEQIRGDELTVRSDIYAVGVTLFYLLTGRTPFEGRTVLALCANTLEKTAPSPTAFRKEIPAELAKTILRCLAKTPGERFANYAELHEALTPFTSEAPVPAPLPLRFLAGTIDMFASTIFVGACAMPVQAIAKLDMDWQAVLSLPFALVFLLVNIVLLEGLYGRSLGKAVCGLRVVDSARNVPGMWRAALRALIFNGTPILLSTGPYLILRPDPTSITYAVLSWASSVLMFVVLAALFATARRKNGFAAVHDLLSKTVVVRKPQVALRSVLPVIDSKVTDTSADTKIGEFHVLEILAEQNDERWVLGYDARLLRKVWIHELPADSPQVPEQARKLARPGRLRWLAGRRDEGTCWDAYEAPTGTSLPDLVEAPRSWQEIRFWLLDLAEELAAADADGSCPDVLSLDRVWISADGKAKLLDFPVPGSPQNDQDVPTYPRSEFLKAVACACLAPNAESAPDGAPAAAIPLHARTFLSNTDLHQQPKASADKLRELVRRAPRVGRGRRASLVALCVAFPLICTLMMVGGLFMIRAMLGEHHGELAELYSLLGRRETDRHIEELVEGLRKEPVKNGQILEEGPEPDAEPAKDGKADEGVTTPQDRHYAIYISHRFSKLIQNEQAWKSPFAVSLVKGENRTFAEQSLHDYPSPTEEEVATAIAALGDRVPMRNVGGSQPETVDQVIQKRRTEIKSFASSPNFAIATFAGSLLAYTAIPALFCALLFRGGLIQLALGVTLVKKDGSLAGRLRVFWRGLLIWVPTCAIGIGGIALVLSSISRGPLVSGSLAALTVVLPISLLILLLLPERGIPDRLSGITIVPK